MNARILLVDPDPASLARLRGALEGSGYEVFAARDAGRAAATCGWLRPDLAIVDATCGAALHGELGRSEEGRTVPVVLLGEPGPTSIETFDPGRDRWLERPVTAEELLGVCAQVLACATSPAAATGVSLPDDAPPRDGVERAAPAADPIDALVLDAEGDPQAALPEQLRESLDVLTADEAGIEDLRSSLVESSIHEFRVDLPERSAEQPWAADGGQDIGDHLDHLFGEGQEPSTAEPSPPPEPTAAQSPPAPSEPEEDYEAPPSADPRDVAWIDQPEVAAAPQGIPLEEPRPGPVEAWAPAEPVPDTGSVVHFEDFPLEDSAEFVPDGTLALDAPAPPGAELGDSVPPPFQGTERRAGPEYASSLAGAREKSSALGRAIVLGVIVAAIAVGATAFFLLHDDGAEVPEAPAAPAAPAAAPRAEPADPGPEAAAPENATIRLRRDPTPDPVPAAPAPIEDPGAEGSGGPEPAEVAPPESVPAAAPVEAPPPPVPSVRPDGPAALVERVEPDLPAATFAAPEMLVLRILIGENGRVVRVLVDRPISQRAVEEATILAVLDWRYRPAIENGVPARQWVTESFRFGPPAAPRTE